MKPCDSAIVISDVSVIRKCGILLESMEIGITCPFCASIGCHFYALLLLVARKKSGMQMCMSSYALIKGRLISIES